MSMWSCLEDIQGETSGLQLGLYMEYRNQDTVDRWGLSVAHKVTQGDGVA